MNRRTFLEVGAAVALLDIAPISGLLPSEVLADRQTSRKQGDRQPVLVRAGLTRRPDGTEEPTTSQQTIVRSFDSERRLAVFVVPIGEHDPYDGAPLHVHHEQDEWLYILAGEFVAEVGGKRMRLKAGDSLLMPMKVPHRWSHGGQSHSGAIHLYTPAGLMDVWWDSGPNDKAPQTLDQRKAEFESHGVTLLGTPLSKEDIDQTL